MPDVYSAFYEFSSLLESKVYSLMFIQTNIESTLRIIEDSDILWCTCKRKDIMSCYPKEKILQIVFQLFYGSLECSVVVWTT
jgi:hypothetical protein